MAIYVSPEAKKGISIAGNAPARPAPSGATSIESGIPAGISIKPVVFLNAKSEIASFPFTNTSTIAASGSGEL